MKWWQSVSSRIATFVRNMAPVRYKSKYGSGLTNANNAAVESMTAAGTQYAILRLLSQSTAQVDWHLYRTNPDGYLSRGPSDDDSRMEVMRHQALSVFNRPNPLMHRQLFIERTQLSLDQEGEAFWLVVKVGNIPMEMWPAYPSRMTEVINNGGELIGWSYREPDGSRTYFEAAEVIQIQMPDPSNIFRGVGPSAALMPDLEAFRAAGEYNRNFFRNSAVPGGFYLVPEHMGDEEFNEFVQRQRELHRGVSNAHRVGLLENGITWQDSSTSMKDMQFAELRNQSRDLIRETYGVHKAMLGQSDDVNRANAIAAEATLARWQIVPRLERIKAALNYSFLPMFGATGAGVEFCYDNPVPPNLEEENAERDSKVNAAVALISIGADPVECLAAFGLPPIPFVTSPSPVSLPSPPPELEAVA